MERIITENIYQPKLAVYRGLPIYSGDHSSLIISNQFWNLLKDVSDDTGDSSTSHLLDIPNSIGPTINRLWSFNCPLTMVMNPITVAGHMKMFFFCSRVKMFLVWLGIRKIRIC